MLNSIGYSLYTHVVCILTSQHSFFFRGESVDEVSFIISGSLEVIQDDEVRDAKITSASARWWRSHDVSCWCDCGGSVAASCSGLHRNDMHHHHYRQKTLFILTLSLTNTSTAKRQYNTLSHPGFNKTTKIFNIPVNCLVFSV